MDTLGSASDWLLGLCTLAVQLPRATLCAGDPGALIVDHQVVCNTLNLCRRTHRRPLCEPARERLRPVRGESGPHFPGRCGFHGGRCVRGPAGGPPPPRPVQEQPNASIQRHRRHPQLSRHHPRGGKPPERTPIAFVLFILLVSKKCELVCCGWTPDWVQWSGRLLRLFAYRSISAVLRSRQRCPFVTEPNSGSRMLAYCFVFIHAPHLERIQRLPLRS